MQQEINRKTREVHKHAKPPKGIVINVVSAQITAPFFKPVFIELKNQANLDIVERSLIKDDKIKRTGLAPKNKAEWNHNFFYNSEEMVDDNITFVMKTDDYQEVGRETVRNFSNIIDSDTKQDDVIKHEVTLRKDKQEVAIVYLQVTLFEKEDLIGGIQMPNLSLKPPLGFKAQYSAVDLYNTNCKDKKNNPTRPNCFSFLDGCAEGEAIPPYEDMDFISFKYKGSQPKKKSDKF